MGRMKFMVSSLSIRDPSRGLDKEWSCTVDFEAHDQTGPFCQSFGRTEHEARLRAGYLCHALNKIEVNYVEDRAD